ncbi:hypothetical protein ACLB2K_068135 [Fragaria x ananassa]
MEVAAKIAPFMLSSEFADLASEAHRMLKDGTDWLHMDIMVVVVCVCVGCGGRYDSVFQQIPLKELLGWRQATVLSCDRASLLVAQDPKVVISAVMKVAAGFPSVVEERDVDAYLAAARAYVAASSSSPSGDAHDALAREPVPLIRAYEIDEWSRSKELKWQQDLVRNNAKSQEDLSSLLAADVVTFAPVGSYVSTSLLSPMRYHFFIFPISTCFKSFSMIFLVGLRQPGKAKEKNKTIRKKKKKKTTKGKVIIIHSKTSGLNPCKVKPFATLKSFLFQEETISNASHIEAGRALGSKL